LVEIFDNLNHPLHFLWFSVGEQQGVKAAQDDPESFAQRREVPLRRAATWVDL